MSRESVRLVRFVESGLVLLNGALSVGLAAAHEGADPKCGVCQG
ncbi:MAG: hypothetical protein AAF224_11895 [Pseudomonadota bacterium]